MPPQRLPQLHLRQVPLRPQVPLYSSSAPTSSSAPLPFKCPYVLKCPFTFQVPLRPQVPLRHPKGMISVPHRISVPHQVTVPHRISVPHQDPVQCWTWMPHQVQCAISHREATIRCQSLVGLRRFITLCLLNVFHNSISVNVSLAVETSPAVSTRTFHSEPPLTSESRMHKIPAGVYKGSLFAVPGFLKEKNYQGRNKLMPHATHDRPNPKTNERAPSAMPNATQRPRKL